MNQPMALRPKVISIMGTGHTGSTVLAVALGNHRRIESTGELHKLPRSTWPRDENRRCACGSPVHACLYWTEVRSRWAERVGEDALAHYLELQTRFERTRSFSRLLMEARRPSTHFTSYVEITGALYEAISAVSGKQVIVDSSKPPVRNYALLLNPHLDVRLIHLVRDGRAVVWSMLRGRRQDVAGGIPRDRPPPPPWRTSIRWALTNLASEWVIARAGEARGLRVTYESFVERPEEVLHSIAAVADEDLSMVAEALVERRALDVGHNVGGNRLRMSGAVVLRPNMEWKARLSTRDQETFWRVAGLVARRYGYSR
jgi:hypothetical protein